MVSRVIIKKVGSPSYLVGLQKAFHSKLRTYPGFIESTSYLETPERTTVITVSKWKSNDDWEKWFNSSEREYCKGLAKIDSQKTLPFPTEKVICFATKLSKYELEDTPFLL